MTKSNLHIGIDLGGTKIEAIAMDDSGAALARRRVATPKGDYQGTVAPLIPSWRGESPKFRGHGSSG